MKKKATKLNCGQNIRRIRLEKGLTQTELGDKVGVSKRMIIHYEKHAISPPADKLTAIAKALKVSLEELMGIKPIKTDRPANPRLWKKLKVVDNLSKADQKFVLRMIEGLASKNGQ